MKKKKEMPLGYRKLSPEDLDKVFREWTEGNDRTVAILGASLMENILEELLRGRFRADEEIIDWLFNPESPLGSFKAKIEVSHALGIISQSARKDLLIIKDIRNRFAHKLLMNDSSMSFDHVTFKAQQIASWCQNLTFGQGNPRDKFMSTCMAILSSAADSYTKGLKYKPLTRPFI